MQAFAQFASDLEKSTQQQLARGERLVEVLKQGQYKPMAVEKQVLVIFAASKGYVDDVAVDDLGDYETQLLAHFESKHKAVLDELKAVGKLDDGIDAGLRAGIEEFNATFSA